MAKKFLPLKKYLNPINLFLGILALLIALNATSLFSTAFKIQRERLQKPFYFSGFQFLGLQDILHGETHIGYLTDKDFNDKQNAAQFAQAQYLLSPVILDLNNTNHTYILFDFTDEKKALKKIRSIGAAPLKKHGSLILAVKTK